MELPMPDGSAVVGTLEEITAAGKTAYIVLREDVSGRRLIGNLPLTPEETRAVETHGDAIFGKENGGTRLPDGDYFGLYDWFLMAQSATTRDALLSQLKSHHRFLEFEMLPTPELRIRVARELVKGAAQSKKRRVADALDPSR